MSASCGRSGWGISIITVRREAKDVHKPVPHILPQGWISEQSRNYKAQNITLWSHKWRREKPGILTVKSQKERHQTVQRSHQLTSGHALFLMFSNTFILIQFNKRVYFLFTKATNGKKVDNLKFRLRHFLSIRWPRAPDTSHLWSHILVTDSILVG